MTVVQLGPDRRSKKEPMQHGESRPANRAPENPLRSPPPRITDAAVAVAAGVAALGETG